MKAKSILIFGTGVTVGFISCGAMVAEKMLSSEEMKKAICRIISRKVDDTLFGHAEDNKKSHKKPTYPYHFRGCVAESDDTVCFSDCEDAVAVLAYMRDIIKDYGCATIADLYDLCGIASAYTDTKYGWTNLDDATVISDGFGYDIFMPNLKRLEA